MSNMETLLMIALVSVVSGIGHSSELAIFERQEALISFRYISDALGPFSLGIGHRSPFYVDGQFIIERLSSSQLHRFQVNAWHSQTRHYTMIHLRIHGVQRTDGGKYTCKFGTPQRLQVNNLTVNFPPGRADCRVKPTNENMMEIVRCSATGGNPLGRIICLDTKNEEIPYRGDVGQNGTRILHEIVIQQNASVYCCAINGASLVKHKCNDFVLEREYNYRMDKYTTPTQMKSGKYNPIVTLVTSLQTVNNGTTTRRFSDHVLMTTSIATFVLSIIILITSLCICVAHRKHVSNTGRCKKQHTVHQNVTSTNPTSGKEAEQCNIKQSGGDDVNKREYVKKQDDASEIHDNSMKDRFQLKDVGVPSTSRENRIPPFTESED